MKYSIISFTYNGIQLSRKLEEILEKEEVTAYTKCSAITKLQCQPDIEFVHCSISEWAKQQMEEKKVLIFIGACGIAVRAIAPHITDKLHDSPVLVMDEKGEYVIPILSGHMGGANELACWISEKMRAIPVITTATDINKKFSVDLFAKKNNLAIVNKEGIAKVSSKVLTIDETSNLEVTISIETGHIKSNAYMPAGLRLVSYPPNQPVDIIITSQVQEYEEHFCYNVKSNLDDKIVRASLVLQPKEYVIGIGCRKGKEADKIEQFIRRSMEELGILNRQILALASIAQKREEQGLIEWSTKAGVLFVTYTAEELKAVEGNFHESAFVAKKVGVGNVCERAALKKCGAGAMLVYEKHAEDGMTIAIAKRNWSVIFDET